MLMVLILRNEWGKKCRLIQSHHQSAAQRLLVSVDCGEATGQRTAFNFGISGLKRSLGSLKGGAASKGKRLDWQNHLVQCQLLLVLLLQYLD